MDKTQTVIILDGVLYWTVQRAAREIGKNDRAIYNAMREGKLQPDARMGRSPLFLPTQIRAMFPNTVGSKPAGYYTTAELAAALGKPAGYNINRTLRKHGIAPDATDGTFDYYSPETLAALRDPIWSQAVGRPRKRRRRANTRTTDADGNE